MSAVKDLPTIPKKVKTLASYDGGDEFEGDDFIDDVQAIIKKLKTNKFFCYGLSLTWRNVAGYTEFETTSAVTLIDKITPNGDYTITFTESGEKGIVEVRISHHDKPMGETMYLMSQTMEKKLGIKELYFR